MKDNVGPDEGNIVTGMPYGGVINWMLPKDKSVHQESVHHGYRHIVAWGVRLGSYAYYIEMQCQRAKDDGAPKDAIYLSGINHSPQPRVWHTFDGLRLKNPRAGEEIEEYVKAMVRLEKEMARQ